ncbi:MAG: BolA family transcriptional regulator [Deltaproteobacteria bacterium]|nr:BolA family transcriptional regulator [Deltaproteobacteria bacterium]
MTTVESIKKSLTEQFHPTHLEVHDDSAAHAGHEGARLSGGGHYTVVIVADGFAEKNAVARHRLIYAALQNEMKDAIHALAIQAFTPTEWQVRR